MNALLIGREPAVSLGCSFVTEQPYDLVVIGSLTLGQLLRFRDERVLAALAEGKPVLLYEPGLPEASKNRSLAAALASARRELKSWGIRFTSGSPKRLITAQEARALLYAGEKPASGSVLTPLAREILEGKE